MLLNKFATSPLVVRQEESESMLYMIRGLLKKQIHPSIYIQTFTCGLHISHIFYSIVVKSSTTYQELLQKANQNIVDESLVAEKRWMERS